MCLWAPGNSSPSVGRLLPLSFLPPRVLPTDPRSQCLLGHPSVWEALSSGLCNSTKLTSECSVLLTELGVTWKKQLACRVFFLSLLFTDKSLQQNQPTLGQQGRSLLLHSAVSNLDRSLLWLTGMQEERKTCVCPLLCPRTRLSSLISTWLKPELLLFFCCSTFFFYF